MIMMIPRRRSNPGFDVLQSDISNMFIFSKYKSADAEGSSSVGQGVSINSHVYG